MIDDSRGEAAERAGVGVDELTALVELGPVELGPVELKGLAGAMGLYAAHRDS